MLEMTQSISFAPFSNSPPSNNSNNLNSGSVQSPDSQTMKKIPRPVLSTPTETRSLSSVNVSFPLKDENRSPESPNKPIVILPKKVIGFNVNGKELGRVASPAPIPELSTFILYPSLTTKLHRNSSAPIARKISFVSLTPENREGIDSLQSTASSINTISENALEKTPLTRGVSSPIEITAKKKQEEEDFFDDTPGFLLSETSV